MNDIELNTVHHMDNREGLPLIPEKSVNLIIADPPYFEVKGEFDFVWESFDEYLKFMEGQAVLYKRILADNGTLFVWGMDRKIAYVQTVFDKYFTLYSTLVWEKPSIANEWDSRRTFPERGQERLLMYGNEDDYHDSVRGSIKEVQEYLNGLISYDELADLLLQTGNCKNRASAKQNAINILSQRSAKPQLITESQYCLINKEKIPYRDLLSLKFAPYRRPFDNFLNLTDVLRFSRVHDAVHPTQKPEYLTRALILTCSRLGDTVCVPFAGSGTECAMAAKEGRKFIGFEISADYAAMSTKRVQSILSQPTLFQ